jgi:hypothetical protein
MQVVIILSYPFNSCAVLPENFHQSLVKKKNHGSAVTDLSQMIFIMPMVARQVRRISRLGWCGCRMPTTSTYSSSSVQQVTRCVYLRPSIIICLYAWSDTFILYSIVPLKNDYIEMQVHFWKSSFGSFSWKVKRLILLIIKRRDESGESAWCYFRM